MWKRAPNCALCLATVNIIRRRHNEMVKSSGLNQQFSVDDDGPSGIPSTTLFWWILSFFLSISRFLSLCFPPLKMGQRLAAYADMMDWSYPSIARKSTSTPPSLQKRALVYSSAKLGSRKDPNRNSLEAKKAFSLSRHCLTRVTRDLLSALTTIDAQSIVSTH